MQAYADSGYAFWSDHGRIKIRQVGGVATIGAAETSVSVPLGVDINADTFVLLTPMADIGARAVWFTKQGAQHKFVIHMSSTRSGPTKVAWLALERG